MRGGTCVHQGKATGEYAPSCVHEREGENGHRAACRVRRAAKVYLGADAIKSLSWLSPREKKILRDFCPNVFAVPTVLLFNKHRRRLKLERAPMSLAAEG